MGNSADDLLHLARSIATIVPHRDSDAAGLTTSPPVLLMMSCGQPANSGGECVVIDGKAVHDDLAESNPKALLALSGPRSVLFGGAAGYLGSIFTRIGDRITIRLRLDELAQFSPEVTHWLPVLRATIDRHVTMFSLDAGQGYILDNYRWLHGRRAFSGQRVMYRVNGNPRPDLELAPGFWPAHIPAPTPTCAT